MYSLQLLGGVLLQGPSGPLSGRAVQRRQLALVALLACARYKGLTRDKLIGYLWPETDGERARRHLSDAIYVLRRALGEEAVLSVGEVVRLDPESVRCDVCAFEDALETEDVEAAVAQYEGPFLDGFYLGDGREFEGWVEAERARLGDRYASALESLAKQAEEVGEYQGAAEWWKQLAAHDPFNSRVILRLMEALAAAGDPANALEILRVHELRLRDELGLELREELRSLLERLRAEPVAGEAALAGAPQDRLGPVPSLHVAPAWRARTPSSGLPRNWRGWVHEIHRRSLWQVLLIYAGAGWVVFEIVQTVTEGLGLPRWFPAFAALLLLIGLPVVLATAFVREDESVGTEPTLVPVGEPGSAVAHRRRWLTWRNAGFSFMAALAVWGVVATGWLLVGGRSAASGDERKSIAVLPFENLSGDDENEAFTNGVHDVILSHLYKIADLRPTSRTSVMEYKDTRKNIRQIAQELGVETVMEGGVQRAGDRVLVTVQLIDAQTDEHIWAETYDRELTLENVFGIQAEIAQRIAKALRAEITADEEERLTRLPTDNSEAYNYYLTGDEYLRRTFTVVRRKTAEQMFRSAIALDPNFALAYAKLSMTHLNLRRSTNPEFKTQERLDSAKVAAEKALDLDPDLAEAHIALGQTYAALGDRDRADRQYATALRLSPNDAQIWQIKGRRARARGNFEEALATYERALELSPREELTLLYLAQTYTLLGKYDEAESYFDRLMTLDPDRCPGCTWKVYFLLNQPDGRERAWEVIEQMSSGRPPNWSGDRPHHRAVLRIFHERVKEGVYGMRERREEFEEKGWSAQDYFLTLATVYALDGQVDLGIAYYDSARVALEPVIHRLPENPFARQNLGVAYAGLGRAEEAVREGRAAVDLMPVSENATNGPSLLWSLAEIYVMVKDYEAAIDQLETVLSIPSLFSSAILRLDPLYDPLRDHPRFQALLAKYE